MKKAIVFCGIFMGIGSFCVANNFPAGGMITEADEHPYNVLEELTDAQPTDLPQTPASLTQECKDCCLCALVGFCANECWENQIAFLSLWLRK